MSEGASLNRRLLGYVGYLWAFDSRRPILTLDLRQCRGVLRRCNVIVTNLNAMRLLRRLRPSRASLTTFASNGVRSFFPNLPSIACCADTPTRRLDLSKYSRETHIDPGATRTSSTNLGMFVQFFCRSRIDRVHDELGSSNFILSYLHAQLDGTNIVIYGMNNFLLIGY